MTLTGARKREYQRKWERDRRKPRSGHRHVSPATIGRFALSWTPADNPATRPHETEAYDPVKLEGYDPESTPWRPKWDDQAAGTVEDWELTAEPTSRPVGMPASNVKPVDG